MYNVFVSRLPLLAVSSPQMEIWSQYACEASATVRSWASNKSGYVKLLPVIAVGMEL